MTLRMPFRTIRAQLAVWFVLVAAAPLLLFAFLDFGQRAEVIRDEAMSKLASVRDLKLHRINDWIDELSSDLGTISADARDLLVPGGRLPADTGARTVRELRARLTNWTRFHPGISGLAVLDAETGRVLVSTIPEHEGDDRSGTPAFEEPIRSRCLYIRGIHESAVTGKPRMTFSSPVLIAGAGGTAVAVVVADIDLKVLDELLGERSGLGETGETLIVNGDAVMMTDVRWSPNARLRLKTSALPSVLASQGKTGVIEALDYRGVPVLAAYGHLPKTGWGFVAKQDRDELLEPVARLERLLLFLVPAGLALVGILAVIVAGYFSRPLVEIRAVAEAFGRGDLSSRNHVDRSDELGSLGRAFNAMAESVERESTVATGNRDVAAAMVEPASVADFCRELLSVVVRVTRSDLGAFFLPAAGGRLVPASSVGLSVEALVPFDLARGEGAFGAAVASGKVTHLREIPADTRFTFRTVAGTAVPREMLTIPVVAGEKLVGLLALASLREYPPEALAIVDKSLVAIGLGLSNILAGEQTRALADELAARNADLTTQGEELSAQSLELARQSQTLGEQFVELQAQSAQVAEANRMKSEFLSNMSHELRTPLNSVLALSRVLQMQGRDRLTPEETGYLEIIERNGKQLLSLINDVLDLAKIESGRADVVLEEVGVAERIRAIGEGLEPVCREKGVGFSVEVEPGLPPLVTDAKRLHQILQNVIGNAVKFTREGSVTVTARRRGQELEVVVADTGIGIPAEELPHIFEEFRQVDGSTSRSFEGTGLGLSIASRSAWLLGGRIGVTSVPGAGSTFTVTIPFAPAVLSEREVRPAAAAPLAIGPGGGGNRLLLVEDSEPAIVQIRMVLEAEGYLVDVARGGEEALERMRSSPPDGIILDLMMPLVDGFTVLDRMRGTPRTAHTPVLILTAKDLTREELGRLSANHVHQLIRKGDVDRVELVAAVARLLGRGEPGPGFRPGAEGEAARPGVPRGRRGDRRPPKVLAIDDNPDNLATLRAILKGRCVLVEAESGEDGILAARTERPDLIFLDMSLPGLDGREVVARLRTDEVTRNVPVVALTAHAMKGDREAFLAAGCDGYVAKPIDVETLLAVVEEWTRPRTEAGEGERR